jgi:hypothetical protein
MVINDNHLEKYLERFFEKVRPLLGVVSWSYYHILYGDDVSRRKYLIYYKTYGTTDNIHWRLTEDIKYIRITAEKMAEIIGEDEDFRIGL